MWSLLIVAAVGAEVPAGVLPLVERASIQIGWSEKARAAGAEGLAAVAACRPFAEDLVICFTVPEGDGQRMVHQADLEAWGADLAVVEQRAVAATKVGLTQQRPQRVPVDGDPRTYLLSAEGDGLDQAALFAPAALDERCGQHGCAVGIPARGVLVAFPMGDRELETIVAVGIRRLWESLDDPITPVAYRWDGQAWVVWGEAKPSGGIEKAPSDPLLARPPG